jgi:hypothetical protein
MCGRAAGGGGGDLLIRLKKKDYMFWAVKGGGYPYFENTVPLTRKHFMSTPQQTF